MPTAIEYGVVHNWHVQNGAGTGPPNQQDATVAQLPVEPAMSAGELLFAGPLALSFLAAVVVAAMRRRPHSTGP